jgi:hypothetical protein
LAIAEQRRAEKLRYDRTGGFRAFVLHESPEIHDENDGGVHSEPRLTLADVRSRGRHLADPGFDGGSLHVVNYVAIRRRYVTSLHVVDVGEFGLGEGPVNVGVHQLSNCFGRFLGGSKDGGRVTGNTICCPSVYGGQYGALAAEVLVETRAKTAALR